MWVVQAPCIACVAVCCCVAVYSDVLRYDVLQCTMQRTVCKCLQCQVCVGVRVGVGLHLAFGVSIYVSVCVYVGVCVCVCVCVKVCV